MPAPHDWAAPETSGRVHAVITTHDHSPGRAPANRLAELPVTVDLRPDRILSAGRALSATSCVRYGEVLKREFASPVD
jgi:hypothetical protein